MSDSGTSTLPWLVVRRDDNGNRYTVSRCATRIEAEKIADRLDRHGQNHNNNHLYLIERIDQINGGDPQNRRNGTP
ncbi:SPOR domain-containing protein [Streptomyces sp. CA-288835]|uniref:SPOR domain-containing protein n=1 Tax=Streptomyces sp. CA-288835 TaxID=3240069 RepID=UPI003D919455